MEGRTFGQCGTQNRSSIQSAVVDILRCAAIKRRSNSRSNLKTHFGQLLQSQIRTLIPGNLENSRLDKFWQYPLRLDVKQKKEEAKT